MVVNSNLQLKIIEIKNKNQLISIKMGVVTIENCWSFGSKQNLKNLS